MKRFVIGLSMLFGLSCGLVTRGADFNGDGTNDIGVFRANSGLWAIRGFTRVYFGSSNDEPLPGDYNGDGTVDIGIFRPASGLWAIRNLTRIYFGGSSDEPLVGISAGGGGGLWSQSGSNIYYDNGNVGIGTTNPIQKLTVVGSHNLNPSFPDGLCGTPIAYNLGSGNYTVPEGKTLYITNVLNGVYGNNLLYIDGCCLVYFSTQYESKSFSSPLVAGTGEVVNSFYDYTLYFNGILLDEGVTPISYNLSFASYTVPEGKTLYITNAINIYDGINGLSIDAGDGYCTVASFAALNESTSFASPIIADEGHMVDNVHDGIYFNGYLTDR